MLQKIKERIFAGGEITPDEALELAQKAIRSDLYTAADEIRKKFCNKTLDTCSIINARSGHCPENCKWCAQSAHHHTQIETYDARSKQSELSCKNLFTVCTAIFAANSTGKLNTPVDIEGNAIDLIPLSIASFIELK